MSASTSPRLSPEESAAYAAVGTATGNMPGVCRPRYNPVVLKDPQEEGWLVWMLAPSPAVGVVPAGGHFRFSITADGKTVKRRDALSTTCMLLDPRSGAPPGARPVGAALGHVVSPTPVETHVFLNLLYRLPLFIEAGGAHWQVSEGRITRRR